jgi:hypothetical protein
MKTSPYYALRTSDGATSTLRGDGATAEGSVVPRAMTASPDAFGVGHFWVDPDRL